MDSKCFLTSTDPQTRRARCQHQLSFLYKVVWHQIWGEVVVLIPSSFADPFWI